MEASRVARVAALREKLQSLAAELGLEEPRLYQEVVRLVDRQDTSEEIQRVRSHVAQARGLLEAPEAVGKRLDFLPRELNRVAETNRPIAHVAGGIQEVGVAQGD